MDTNVSFTATVDALPGPVAVTRVEIGDALNEVASATMTLTLSDHVAPEEDDLLGTGVELTLSSPSGSRVYRGVVHAASIQRTPDDRPEVVLRTASRLSLLAQGLDSRIFQDLSIPEIVEKVLERADGIAATGVDHQLTDTYPTLEYVVQYRESDWAFVMRLLSEAGISAALFQEGDREVLVLFDRSDGRDSYSPAGAELPYRDDPGLGYGGDHATLVARQRAVGPTTYSTRGYDWTNPPLQVEGTAITEVAGGSGVEHYDHELPIRYFEYSPHQYTRSNPEERAKLLRVSGDLSREHYQVHTNAVSARPGTTFEITGHPEGLDGRYLITAVDATGLTTEGELGTLDVSLECLPIEMRHRAPMPRRPIALPTTAVVVGPAGEEIHTDEHGRIKVQFHWDREGGRDDHSSCWLRVAQTWAGAGWGAWILPRIDMEVLVTFLEGDPDRPLVTGCVYNGDNRTPYPLPKHKTRSTLKSRSSPGGDGYNELRFEDRKGDEEIWIHAQKDFNEKVLHDHNTKVDHCQTNVVDVDQYEHIGRDQTLVVDNDRAKTVKRDEVTEVGQDRTETVMHDEKVTVVNDRVHRVQHDDSLYVENRQETVISNGQLYKVEAKGRETHIAPDDVTFVDSRSATAVGTQWKSTCKDTELRLDARTIEGVTPNKIQLDVDSGAATLVMKGQGGTALIECGKSITLKVGSSVIKITGSEISISSPLVKIDGSNNVLINCP